MSAMSNTTPTKPFTSEDFCRRAASISSLAHLRSLRSDAVATENLYRELFARRRESWEVPEIDDPKVFLVDVFPATTDLAEGGESASGASQEASKKPADRRTRAELFRLLPRFEDDDEPRCFERKEGGGADGAKEGEPEEGNDPILIANAPAPTSDLDGGIDAVVPVKSEFDLSWDCLTEGILRFINWDNVIAAGGAVAGCLSPLPPSVASGGPSSTRVKRRKYFHDTYLPSSDIDLFLHGLTEEKAEGKLLEIFDAVQAANPYEVRAFRSAHAVTLVSRYPFRHVQVVLRLYNSPAEVLMGFDVDACAVGYDGSNVFCCPRAALAIMSRTNAVDMSRRSPSYEMRLAKYASRGYEVLVPGLDRDRIDPFLYEKRFDQTKGLARLLLLERLRTPEERLRYRIEGQLKRGAGRSDGGNSRAIQYKIQAKLRKAMRDRRNLDRSEGTEGVVPPPTGAEASDYSTVFLPWGPEWTADRIERLTRRKDKLLNKIEFLPDGRVVKRRRPYKVHVCAVGTMEEVIGDPFPDDPPIPDDIPPEALDTLVRDNLSWLVDNPGRQQIGSFHPITDEDWTKGAYISRETEELIRSVVADDAVAIERRLGSCQTDEETSALLHARDFLGRSALHVAALARVPSACRALLGRPEADAEFLGGRLVDGRTALHLASMRGDAEIVDAILGRRKELAELGKIPAEDVLDVDGSDWEVKLSPLQYAVAFGHAEVVDTLLSSGGANARKPAVHKDRNEGLSLLSLLAFHASESGGIGADGGAAVPKIMRALFDAGASTAQVDTSGRTCWHSLAESPASVRVLKVFLEEDASRNGGRARALDVLDGRLRTAVYVATEAGNAGAVKALLRAGASATFSEDEWAARVRQVREATAAAAGGGGGRMVHHTYIRHGGGVTIQEEQLRVPIALAAQNADGPCLEAFVSSDVSLANAVVHKPKVNCGRHRQGGDNTEPSRPLDLLEETRTAVAGTQVSVANELRIAKDRAATVHNAKTRAEKAQEERDASAEGTYERHIWSLVACREGQAMNAAEKNARTSQPSEEDERAEAEALKRIDEACRVLRDAGGEPHPRDDSEESSQEIPAPFGRNNHRTGGVGQDLPDPLQGFSELTPLDFYSAAGMMAGARFARLPNSDQPKALDLMRAASAGDAGAFEIAAIRSRVCIVDCVGSTPLFVAVTMGDGDVAKVVYQAAGRQFALHIERQKNSLRRAEAGDKSEEFEDVLKDQLRRFNNLDLAAGETPQSSGPTPDQMRLRLEAAEAAALRQGEAGTADSETALSSSPVSPDALLLHRSIVLSSSEPRLAELQDRLARELPETFPGKPCEPVRLRPIELAVIRADVEMVKALLGLVVSMGGGKEEAGAGDGMAVGGGTNASQKEENHGEDGEEKSSEDRDSEEVSEDEGCYSEDEDYYSEDEAQPQALDARPFSPSQLRWLLAGEGSCNPDLGGMSLLQLAAATDDSSTFCAVASFAAEHALPRAAVAAWIREVEVDHVDEVTKTKRQKHVLEIAGGGSSYNYHGSPGRLPLWSSLGAAIMGGGAPANPAEQSVAVYPTLLQFALSVGARNVSRAIMSGDADDALLGWILSSMGVAPENVNPKGKISRRGYTVSEGAALAGGWLVERTSEDSATHSQLAKRLVRPTALDGAGRTALFYSPPDMVEAVVESAVEATMQTEEAGFSSEAKISVETARKMYLETLTSRGSVTALAAAASAGNSDMVKALLDAGCDRSKPLGSCGWGPLHLAIPSKTASQQRHNWSAMGEEGVCHLILNEHYLEMLPPEGVDFDSWRWGRARNIIELILDGASDAVLDEALLSPKAEHTPLMLAANRGADGPTMSLLLAKTAIQSLNGLARRDGDLNSVLHLAVDASLPQGNLDGIVALLEHSGVSPVIGPNAENGRGATPMELALEAMASVWGKALNQAMANQAQQRAYRHQQRRARLGKGPLPTELPSPADGRDESISVPSIARKAFSLLDGASSNDGFGSRLSVSLDEVQDAKKKLTERAAISTATDQAVWSGQPFRRDGQGSKDYQSEPSGPPAVLAPNQNLMHMRYGNTNVPQWNGWPAQ